MATVPQPHSWTAGDNATSTVMQTLTDTALWNLGSTTSGGSRRALGRLTSAVSQSLGTSGTAAAVLLPAESFDYDNGHSTTTNTSRYTSPTPGVLRVYFSASFAANATGVRTVYLALNGTEITGTRINAAATSALNTMVATEDLIPVNGTTDFVEGWAIQTSGGALNVNSALMLVEWASN